jgi:hypothetical protein
MRIHSESVVTHPRERVYEAYRDRLSAIADYIPDIKEIRVEKREEKDGEIHIHNVWVADRDIPAFARAFLKPEMLEWDDYARWSDEENVVRWELKLHVFRESMTCSGVNSFVEDGDAATKVLIEGDLDIDLKSIPGVPKMLAKGLKPKVEKFIVSLITPNLEQMNVSLQRYLDDQPKA